MTYEKLLASLTFTKEEKEKILLTDQRIQENVPFVYPKLREAYFTGWEERQTY